MNRSHVLATLIAMSMLAGCSGRSGGAPAVKQQQAETKAEAEADDALLRTPSKPITAVANLSPGASGFVLQQMTGKANDDGKPIDTNASVMTADALIFNAQSYSAETVQLVKTAVQERKRVIVDSDGTPEGRRAVEEALAQALDGKSMGGAAAALITVYSADRFNITALDMPGESESSATPANVLGLN
jgi:hypothetical protein